MCQKSGTQGNDDLTGVQLLASQGILVHPEERRLDRQALLHFQFGIIDTAIPRGKRLLSQLSSVGRSKSRSEDQHWHQHRPNSYVSNLSSVSTDRYRSLPNQRGTIL
jgi:hypothetical protein